MVCAVESEGDGVVWIDRADEGSCVFSRIQGSDGTIGFVAGVPDQ